MTRSRQPLRLPTGDHRLLAATALVLLGLAAAIGLLDGVLEGDDLAAYDPAVSAAAVEVRSPALTGVARALTFFGSAEALVPLTLLLLGVLLLWRRWLAGAVVGLGMSSSLLVTIAVKDVVGRSRPPVEVIGPATTGFAFPSGHTLNSTVFLGLVAGLLLVWLRRTWVRAMTVIGYVVAAVGVGLSRVYLGYHWLTDVMAGWSIGLAVLGTMLMGTVLATRHRWPPARLGKTMRARRRR